MTLGDCEQVGLEIHSPAPVFGEGLTPPQAGRRAGAALRKPTSGRTPTSVIDYYRRGLPKALNLLMGGHQRGKHLWRTPGRSPAWKHLWRYAGWTPTSVINYYRRGLPKAQNLLMGGHQRGSTCGLRQGGHQRGNTCGLRQCTRSCGRSATPVHTELRSQRNWSWLGSPLHLRTQASGLFWDSLGVVL